MTWNSANQQEQNEATHQLYVYCHEIDSFMTKASLVSKFISKSARSDKKG